ncbi:MAG TPA: hypothetical protein VJ625_14870 [Propionibacteriaceae bacterium]|nr:hypothetical protein [Propionibacteriaceae bacterium]
MNELLSMLVPLETLEGWPRVQDPTVLQALTLYVGIPLLIAVIVSATILVRAKASARRGDLAEASDPLWVGAQESEQVEPVSDSQDAEARVQATADTSAAEEKAEGGDTGEHVGGAGARW